MSVLADRIRAARCPEAAAVIVAGGSGVRFGGDKLMAELGGMPVLARTLLAFEAAELIGEIVLVTRTEAMSDVRELCRRYGVTKLRLMVPGGRTRLLSAYAGVMSTSPDAGIIAVHDGARPLVTGGLISDAVWAAYRHGAAAPAVPVRDTVKTAENGVVTGTPERRSLFAVQTPQCFEASVIRAALMDAAENAPDVTDDCMAVERLGGQIFLTEGSEENIKLTTPLDLALAELILKRRENP